MHRTRLGFAAMILAIASLSPCASAQEVREGKKYLVGGPLAGEVLPLYPTRHGEDPGRPGCLKDAEGKLLKGPEGQYPELELYPGAVEHYRSYMFKYMPVRGMFDRQSQLKNFPAKELAPQVESYAEPVYHVGRGNAAVYMKVNNPPVPVVRCKPFAPVFRLDLGTLKPGLYAVRVIGAVETKDIQRHRKPVILKFTVNDQMGSEKSTYRQRIGYVDEFYSVCEMYFHAPVERAYRAELCLDAGSQVDLLVANISLDDALAGTVFGAFKTKANLVSAEERAAVREENRPKGKLPPPLPPEERLARDALLWDAMVPINSQPGIVYGMGGDDPKANWPRFGAAGLEPDVIEREYGKWVEVNQLGPVLMKNDKLKLEYTVADLRAGRPLPDPYPYKDNGTGVFTPPLKPAPPKPGDAAPTWVPDPGANPQNWIPVARAVLARLRFIESAINTAAQRYHDFDDREAARDAAILLARYAYDFPSMDSACAFSSIMVQPGAYWRDLRCRQRDQQAYWMNFYSNDIHLLERYDQLFDYIQGNEDLARSLQRFIPRVRSPQDVVAFFDTYLVQNEAKHIMRYNYHTYPDSAMLAAAVLGDPKITDPWMEWQFSATWSYPLSPCGLQDMMISNMDRSGTQNIGSAFYAQGENAANYAGQKNEKYMLAGGNPKYDLRDPKRWPKITESTWFHIRMQMAGLWHTPIGDVTGPEKGRGQWFDMDGWKNMTRLGWRWTRDPGFAYMLKHYYGRYGESAAEWAEIEQAAATQARPPYMNNRSRFLPNWAGILETGLQHDDFRFRRAVMLRLGCGSGHSHADSLDLQYYSHGCAMTCDGGQRGGYSDPGDSISRCHNTIEIDGRNMGVHAWLTALSDADGARYMAAQTVPPVEDVSLVRRQVALIDVDEGKPSDKPLKPADYKPNAALDLNVVTANSYVFDVVRAAGGKQHTYCFHGYVADEVTTNVDLQPLTPAQKSEQEYLKDFRFPERKLRGTAPAELVGTWQISRQFERNSMLRGCFDPKGPVKYARLHLLGRAGDTVMRATQRCNFLKYDLEHLFVQRRSDAGLESVFPAIHEGYAGEPFIRSVRLLDIPGNEGDAARAVAVEVKTTNGHTDVCFADGRPDKVRQAGNVKVAGEFAFYSADANGFRLASLTGGTQLRAPDVSLLPTIRERIARVTKVDYGEKQIWLDQTWKTPSLRDRVMEIGTPATPELRGGHWTTYTIAGSQAAGAGTLLTVRGGADYYLSRVQEVEPETNTVWCGIAKAGSSGLNANWVASNGDGSKTWRASFMGGKRGDGRYAFQLNGPVTMQDFGESREFRLWEYGAGDTVRQSTFASLRLVGAGTYELTADCDLTVGLKAGSIEFSLDQKEWRKLSGRMAGNILECALTVADLGPYGKVYLRTK